MEGRGGVRLMGKTWHNWGGIKGPSEEFELWQSGISGISPEPGHRFNPSSGTMG